jgi:hypothetical protein
MGLRPARYWDIIQRSLNVNAEDLLFPWKNGKPYSEPYLLQEILQPQAKPLELVG